jgi:hypothetical protein
MKGHRISYTAEEMAWLEENKDWPRATLHRIFVMFFGRDDVTLDQIKALCFRKGWKTGRTGTFAKGIVPHNKGKQMPFNPNSARTQFKKGNEPHNTRYLGHERLSKEGYVEISVEQTNPHTGYSRRYVLKHRWLWEQVNGPLPKGMVLKCLDGDRINTDPSNWEAVSRALLPRLAGGRHKKHIAYDEAPDELKPVILTVAKLEHQVRKTRREEREDGRIGQ